MAKGQKPGTQRRSEAMTRARLISWGWVLLVGGVVAVFFQESIFRHHSLVPTDVLHHFLLPHDARNDPIQVQNHYTIDEVTQLYPGAAYWRQTVKGGEAPLWNPYYFGGHPQLGTSMWGVFCPAKLFFLLPSLERGYTFSVILEFFLAAAFMFGFLRELGRSRPAAFVGGCAYALNSQFLMMHWLWMNVFCWVPLVLWLLERAIRRNSWGHALGTSAVLAVAMISGSIQMAFFVVFLCGFYALGLVPWGDSHQRRAVLWRVVVIFGVAGFAGAVQFLPTLELLAREAGGRIHNSDQALPGVRHTILGIPSLIVLVFPALAGSPETFDLLKLVRGNMMDYTGYIGVIPFILFLTGLQLKDSPRKRNLVLLILSVLFIVFFTPLLKFVYHRFFVIAIFAMAVLASAGFDAVMECSEENKARIRRAFRTMLVFATLLAAGLVLAQVYIHSHWDQLVKTGQNYVLGHRQGNQFENHTDWMLGRVPALLSHFTVLNPLFCVPLISIGVASLLWAQFGRGRLNRAWFCAGLVGLTVCDLTVLGRSLVPQVDLQQYPLYPHLDVLAKAQADPALFRVERWFPKRDLVLMNNVLMAYGLSTVQGYESLLPENISMLTNRVGDQFNRVLDLQNVKYVLTDSSVSLPADRFEAAGEAPGVRLFENKTCLPRLQFLPQWRVVPERKMIPALMSTTAFDPREMALLEQDPQLESASAGGSSPSETLAVELRRYSANTVVAHVKCSQPGILLLADTWYPGWKARVDQQTVPLYRADYIMKAVALRQGDHIVEFYFSPDSFKVGLWITSFVAVGALVWGLWLWRRQLGSRKAVRGGLHTSRATSPK